CGDGGGQYQRDGSPHRSTFRVVVSVRACAVSPTLNASRNDITRAPTVAVPRLRRLHRPLSGRVGQNRLGPAAAPATTRDGSCAAPRRLLLRPAALAPWWRLALISLANIGSVSTRRSALMRCASKPTK